MSVPAGELRLRAHHGLCIRFFCGHGYSPAFTRNMEDVQARLARQEPFLLVDGMDSLCSCCPNNHGGVCESQEKVLRYDAAVLRLCGLQSGSTMTWGSLSAAVAGHILEAGAFASVCGDCSWRSLCHTEAG